MGNCCLREPAAAADSDDGVVSSTLRNAAAAAVSDGGAGPSSTLRNCVICLADFVPGDYDQDLRILPMCFHTFHSECWDGYIASCSNPTCPICRAPLMISEQEIIALTIGHRPPSTSVVINRDENGHGDVDAAGRNESGGPGARRRVVVDDEC